MPATGLRFAAFEAAARATAGRALAAYLQRVTELPWGRRLPLRGRALPPPATSATVSRTNRARWRAAAISRVCRPTGAVRRARPPFTRRADMTDARGGVTFTAQPDSRAVGQPGWWPSPLVTTSGDSVAAARVRAARRAPLPNMPAGGAAACSAPLLHDKLKRARARRTPINQALALKYAGVYQRGQPARGSGRAALPDLLAAASDAQPRGPSSNVGIGHWPRPVSRSSGDSCAWAKGPRGLRRAWALARRRRCWAMRGPTTRFARATGCPDPSGFVRTSTERLAQLPRYLKDDAPARRAAAPGSRPRPGAHNHRYGCTGANTSSCARAALVEPATGLDELRFGSSRSCACRSITPARALKTAEPVSPSACESDRRLASGDLTRRGQLFTAARARFAAAALDRHEPGPMIVRFDARGQVAATIPGAGPIRPVHARPFSIVQRVLQPAGERCRQCASPPSRA